MLVRSSPGDGRGHDPCSRYDLESFDKSFGSWTSRRSQNWYNHSTCCRATCQHIHPSRQSPSRVPGPLLCRVQKVSILSYCSLRSEYTVSVVSTAELVVWGPAGQYCQNAMSVRIYILHDPLAHSTPSRSHHASVLPRLNISTCTPSHSSDCHEPREKYCASTEKHVHPLPSNRRYEL